MDDMNNTNLPQDDYRAQYQNYQYVPDNLELRVGFGRRLGAFLLDGVILAIILIAVFSATGFIQANVEFYEKIAVFMESNNYEYMNDLIAQFTKENLMSYMFIPLIVLFFGILEILVAASPGKLLLDIRIAKDNRAKADTQSLLKRYFYKNSAQLLSFLNYLLLVGVLDTLSTLLSLAFIIGCFFVLGRKRQGFHDMLAKTAVYRKDDVLVESN